MRDLLRQRAELRSTFISTCADQFAALRIRDPKDRERFLDLIKDAMASAVHKGEPLPSGSNSCNPTEHQMWGTPQEQHRKREEPTL